MLMSTLPGPARMTGHAERMLEVIRTAGTSWVTRQDIAKGLGKEHGRLTPWELGLLKLFVAQGLIEVETVPTYAPSGTKFKYRAKAK